MRDQPSCPPPSEEVLEIGAPEQFAAQLDAKKGNVAHHLKVLRDAGLVRVVETRQVRGGTEQYYQRTARHMVVAEPQAVGTAAMFAAVAQELDLSPAETHLTLRHLRLGPAKARELGEALTELVDEAEEDAEDQPLHGVLVALYQQALPVDTTSTSDAARPRGAHAPPPPVVEEKDGFHGDFLQS
ncbi:hypothetical protein GCM10010519_08250 [Streptomyces lactacystinicus]